MDMTSTPAQTTSIAMDANETAAANDQRIPTSRSDVRTPSLMTDTISALVAPRQTKQNRRSCARYSGVSAPGIGRLPMYVHPAIPAKTATQNAYRSIDTTISPRPPIWPAGHSVTAYQTRRAFMAMNTAAITVTTPTPTLLARLASDTTTNCAA